jgi:hypothetical protein
MKFLTLIWRNRTKTIGFVSIVLGVMATSPVFSPTWLNWFILINGLLTATVGFINTAQRDALESQIKAQP